MLKLEDVMTTENRVNWGLELLYHTKMFDKYFKILQEHFKDNFSNEITRVINAQPRSLNELYLQSAITKIKHFQMKLYEDGVPMILVSEIPNRCLNRDTPEKYVERFYNES